MQQGGFGGFSFREIAAGVGIKSSSVHYHFPTKEDLAASVIRRWAEYTSELVDKELEKDPNPIRVWIKAFRGTAFSKARMCPCTVLGAASQDLPDPVAKEVKGFFKMCQSKLRADALVLECRPGPGPTPGGHRPGGLREVLRRTRRGRRPNRRQELAAKYEVTYSDEWVADLTSRYNLKLLGQ
jgi:AcrR family transcriptional regulator